MVKQYQPDGSFVYIKEEKDIKNCPKYLKHAVNLTTPLYHGTPKFSGATNCKEEQECEITSKMFTESVEPLVKVRVHYTIDIWETGDYYSFMFIKRKGLIQIGEAKRLFSLPKTIKLFSI